MNNDTVFKIIADLLGCPCNLGGVDDYMLENNGDWCGEHCSNVPDSDCWKKYCELKQVEARGHNNCEYSSEGLCFRGGIKSEYVAGSICAGYRNKFVGGQVK